MLNSVEVLNFFKGLMSAESFEGTAKEQAVLGKVPLYRFSPALITSWDEATDTIQRLRELGQNITWGYDNGVTRSISIIMRVGFRSALRGMHRVEQVCPEFDQDSADLRVRFHMASLMLHELAHAFVCAFASKKVVHEPFMNDGRAAEVGRALEQHMFGGIASNTGWNPHHYGLPFGLHFYDWPNNEIGGDPRKVRTSLAKAGVHTHTYYVLPMDHLVKISKPTFWKEEAERFGITQSIKLPRLLGVRHEFKHELWSCESPSDMDYQAMPPPGDLQPDVYEGIISTNGVAPLPDAAHELKAVINEVAAKQKR
ncbi:hypothetical protein E4T42_07080 [Aureobasidium subglaciale]|nr:hypothetical protein E4T42_07080 [Aureobasidium subglaciale]